MNQNHLHLHVSVTGDDNRYYDRSVKKSVCSENEDSKIESGKTGKLNSSRIKKINKEKLVLKKNNVQYTPLMANSIMKDSSNKQINQKNRIKTQLGNHNSIGLSNISHKKKSFSNSAIHSNANSNKPS